MKRYWNLTVDEGVELGFISLMVALFAWGWGSFMYMIYSLASPWFS